jgi:hypothetical protein
MLLVSLGPQVILLSGTYCNCKAAKVPKSNKALFMKSQITAEGPEILNLQLCCYYAHLT